MKKEEAISWILDRPKSETEDLKRKYPNHDEYIKHYGEYCENNYKQNIDFVHSLGLKCDSVGWCYLEFDRPDVGEILDKIEEYCLKENLFARGGYGCRYVDFEAEWFEIHAPSIDKIEKNGAPYSIYAYQNRNKPLLLRWHRFIPAVVSEKFREVCIANNIQGINFCWAKDIGKYDSTQYAFMYPAHRIKTIACDQGLRYSSDENKSEINIRLNMLGGYLPRLAEVFYNFQFNLQDYYSAKELPETGFSFIQGCTEYIVRNALLVHKDTAEILIRENVLDPKMLSPVLTYRDQIPSGYVEAVLDNDDRFPPFDQNFAVKMEEEYLKIKSIKRPQRKATDNMALKALREAKHERKEDFGKRMRKDVSESLAKTAYAPLTAYYLIADGGILSDEYEFLNYLSANEYTIELKKELSSEELINLPLGVVFCKTADGDKIILTQNRTVIRVSHETFQELEEWSSLAQFFVDAIEM